MGEASEGDLLLEGQWEQPSASWLALNIPAGQAETQRDQRRINPWAAVRGPSLESKKQKIWLSSPIDPPQQKVLKYPFA